MSDSEKFYIVKLEAGNCEIIPSVKLAQLEDPTIVQQWGPFDSLGEAIARRVGLIRAGKCQPQ